MVVYKTHIKNMVNSYLWYTVTLECHQRVKLHNVKVLVTW